MPRPSVPPDGGCPDLPLSYLLGLFLSLCVSPFTTHRDSQEELTRVSPINDQLRESHLQDSRNSGVIHQTERALQALLATVPPDRTREGLGDFSICTSEARALWWRETSKPGAGT